VRRLLGVVESEALDEVTAALLDGSAGRMLELVESLTARGQNVQHFCRELARYFRNLLVAKVVGADSRLIAASSDERRRLAGYAGKFSEEDLTRYVQLILNLYRELQHAAHPRFHLELGLLKLVHAGRLVSIEEALSGGAPSSPPRPAAASPQSPPAPPARDLRSRLVAALRAQGEEFSADAVEHSRVEEAGAEVIFHAPGDQQFSLESGTATLAKHCEQALGRRVKIRVTLAEAPAAAEREAARVAPPAGDAATRAMAHPQVQSFLAAFGGQVREVRDLKERQP
jgi:DNA polymerase-3 subunit gamma/tau